MYKITLLPDAGDSFKNMDKPLQRRIAQKIDWLAENADKVIHAFANRQTYKRYARTTTFSLRADTLTLQQLKKTDRHLKKSCSN